MSGLANDTNSWAPAEDEATLIAERAWLQGAVISSVAYGAELVLFLMCFYLLYQQSSRRLDAPRNQIATLLFCCVIFILGTLFMGSLAKYTQLAFIDNRNFPGGPSAYENVMFSIPVDEIGNVSFVLANWLCDAVIVWRCMVIYKGSRFPLWAIMFPPCLLYLGSFAMGVLWLIQISQTGPFENSAINWTIPYFTLSLSLNVLVTIAIVLRLLSYRHRITNVLGSSHGSQYTSIAAMIVESAAIFSAFSICFLVPFALSSSISSIFLQALGQVQISATLLIIYRVASGKGWSSNTYRSTFDDTSPEFQMNKISRVQFHTERSGETGETSLTAFDKVFVPEGGPAETKDSSRALQSFGSAKDEESYVVDEPISPVPGIGRDALSDTDRYYESSLSSGPPLRYRHDGPHSPV